MSKFSGSVAHSIHLHYKIIGLALPRPEVTPKAGSGTNQYEAVVCAVRLQHRCTFVTLLLPLVWFTYRLVTLWCYLETLQCIP